MCGICGCSSGGTEAHTHHDHGTHAEHDLVHVEQDILAKNDRFAAANRQRLAQAGVLALNLVSSPGSGKTTLLVKTVEELKRSVPVSVIEGDQQTSIDAERIRAAGVRSIQINTGRGCHLDAHAVGHAVDDLPLEPNSVLFIENVGNLVCPAGFDLGEAERVAILSVTEGDDKPLKYPDVFASADTLIISKIDLLPYVDFDVQRCLGHVRAISPDIRVLQLSAKTGHGMALWTDAILASADRIRQRGLCHA